MPVVKGLQAVIILSMNIIIIIIMIIMGIIILEVCVNLLDN